MEAGGVNDILRRQDRCDWSGCSQSGYFRNLISNAVKSGTVDNIYGRYHRFRNGWRW